MVLASAAHILKYFKQWKIKLLILSTNSYEINKFNLNKNKVKFKVIEL